jgi:hypothetical protein
MTRGLFLALLAPAVALGATQPEERTFLPAEAAEAVKVEVVLHVADEKSPTHQRFNKPAYESRPVGSRRTLTAKLQAQWLELLRLNASRTGFSPGNYCVFHPDLAVHFTTRAGRRYEMILCFSCDDMVVLREGVPQSSPVPIGFARQELVAFFRGLFPSDPRWRKHAERPNEKKIDVIEVPMPRANQK